MSDITTANEYSHMGVDRRKVSIVCPWCDCKHETWVSPWEIFGWHVGTRLMPCESDECEACEKQFSYELGIVARTTRIEVLKADGPVVIEQDTHKPAEKTAWQDA